MGARSQQSLKVESSKVRLLLLAKQMPLEVSSDLQDMSVDNSEVLRRKDDD